MAALPSDRHRAFVLSLYQIKPGHGAQVRAAKLAGFGTSKSSPASWAAIASRLAHDEKIQAALREEDERRIRASAPRAIRALAHLIETPSHRDHARGIGMVLDRVHSVETTHRVEVEKFKMTVAERLEFLEKLNALIDDRFTEATLAVVAPADDVSAEMIREARKLDAEGDRALSRSFDVLTSEEVFINLVRLNPSLIDAIRMMSPRGRLGDGALNCVATARTVGSTTS